LEGMFFSKISIFLFFFVGLLFVAYNFIKYSIKLARSIVRYEFNMLTKYGRNSWVVVTGASAGIGKEFSMQFASKGFNIAMIAKNETKLTAVQSEIQRKYPNVMTKIIVKNFKQSMESKFYEEINNELKDLDVSILVNNVGVLLKGMKFHERDPNELRDSMVVNCIPQVMMTRYLLPKMLSRHHKSAVITMSSTVVTEPRKDKALYSATKIFVDYLSSALQKQYPTIDWLSLRPGPVATAMIGKSEPDFQTASTEEFVSGGMSYLGKATSAAGTLKHKIRSMLYK